MAEEKAKRLTERYQKARDRVANHLTLVDEVFYYCVPQYPSILGDQSEGAQRGEEIYDSTAQIALMDLAGELQLALVPPDQNWARLELEPSLAQQLTERERLEIQGELDAQTDDLFRYIRRSNFDTQIHEALINLIASTGALLVQPKDDEFDPIEYETVPMGRFFPERGPGGKIKTVFREFTDAARVLQERFPNAKWSRDFEQKMAEDGNAKLCVIEATVWDFEEKKYTYTVIEKDEPHIALEEDIDTPWVIFRAAVYPNEVLGRWVGIQVLSDVKTLNRAVELYMENATWAIVGAYTTDDYGLTSIPDIRLESGVILPIEPGSTGLQPVQTAGNFNIADTMIETMRRRIEFAFLRAALPDPDGTVKTATEFAARSQEAQRRLGPPFARVYSELILPLITRTRKILLDKGKLRRVAGLTDDQVKVVAVSPLSQAVQEAQVAKVVNLVVTAMQVAPAEVDVVVNKEELLNWALRRSEVPTELLRTARERKQVREVQQQQAQAAQLQALVESGALNGASAAA